MHIDTDLDQPVDADGVGRGYLVGRIVTDDVEMGMAVEYGDGQRLGPVAVGRYLASASGSHSEDMAGRSARETPVTRSDFPCPSTDKSTGSRDDTVGTPAAPWRTGPPAQPQYGH